MILAIDVFHRACVSHEGEQGLVQGEGTIIISDITSVSVANSARGVEPEAVVRSERCV